MVRRFSQPLGIHLENWEDRIIETKKGIVGRCLIESAPTICWARTRGGRRRPDRAQGRRPAPVEARLRQDGRSPAPPRGREKVQARLGTGRSPRRGSGHDHADRVHIAMLLQAAGKSNALRTMSKPNRTRPGFRPLANAPPPCTPATARKTPGRCYASGSAEVRRNNEPRTPLHAVILNGGCRSEGSRAVLRAPTL